MIKLRTNRVFFWALCLSLALHSALLFASFPQRFLFTTIEPLHISLRINEMLPRVTMSEDKTLIKNNPLAEGNSGKISNAPFAISNNGDDCTMLQYTDMIRQKIQSAIIYPLEARKGGIEGRPIVRFTITSNGELVRVELIQTSGFSILDEEAVAAIKRASPFPEIPKSLQKETLTCVQGLAFVLK